MYTYHVEVKGHNAQFLIKLPYGDARDYVEIARRYLRYGNEILVYRVIKKSDTSSHIYLNGMIWKSGNKWYWGTDDKMCKMWWDKKAGRFIEIQNLYRDRQLKSKTV